MSSERAGQGTSAGRDGGWPGRAEPTDPSGRKGARHTSLNDPIRIFTLKTQNAAWKDREDKTFESVARNINSFLAHVQ